MTTTIQALPSSDWVANRIAGSRVEVLWLPPVREWMLYHSRPFSPLFALGYLTSAVAAALKPMTMTKMTPTETSVVAVLSTRPPTPTVLPRP